MAKQAVNKAEFILGLIQTAQETIWKNELALAYNEKFGEGLDKEEKAKSAFYAIEKDKEYIDFLTIELNTQE